MQLSQHLHIFSNLTCCLPIEVLEEPALLVGGHDLAQVPGPEVDPDNLAVHAARDQRHAVLVLKDDVYFQITIFFQHRVENFLYYMFKKY